MHDRTWRAFELCWDTRAREDELRQYEWPHALGRLQHLGERFATPAEVLPREHRQAYHDDGKRGNG